MLSQIPSLRIFLPFVAGIAIWQSGFRYFSVLHTFVVALLVLFIFIALQIRSSFTQFKYKWQNGLPIQSLLLIFGYAICAVQQTHLHPKHYSMHQVDSAYTIIKIVEPLEAKPHSFKTLGQVQKIITKQQTVSTIGNTYLYFTNTTTAPNLLPGDEIFVQSTMIPLPPSLNPGGFDYAMYSRQKGITHKLNVKPSQYMLYQKNAATFSTFFANQKIKCLAILHQYITDSNAIGIADALLVGDRTLIDDDTWDAYKNTGIVHIIAISGMHLGIVFNQLLGLLLLVPLFKKHDKITIVFALLLMWAFSCLIGMPPSVARAGFIFTIMGIGKIIGRKNYTYNSLIVSAFLLLCIQPNWLVDVGFLLSYAAILGILLFARTWQNIFYSKYKIIQYINTTIATTTAAQVFTLPICMYYFHQFPIILLLSNLIAIIVTTYILYAEIILLACSWWPWLAKYLASIITFSILSLNKLIFWLSAIPFANIKHISISVWQYIFLSIGISLIAWAIIKKKSMALFIASCCFIAFLGMHIYTNWQALHQQKLIVHQAKTKSMLQILNGSKHQVVHTDSITKSDINYILEPAQMLYKANDTMLLPITKTPSYHLSIVHGKSIVQLFGNIDSTSFADSIDLVILCKNAKIDLPQIVAQLHPKKIIIDGANSLWKIEQWINEASDLHLPIYNTAKQSAFIADL
jgi:competence protein ComEC